MNQNFYNPNASSFDQFQPPQLPIIQQFPQEMSKEILQARENLLETIQTFLKKFDHIPPEEKPLAFLLAEDKFLKIKQAIEEEQNQPEDIQELMLKLLNDLKICDGILLKQEEQAVQEEQEEQTAQKTESEKLIKSSVENLVPNPQESSRIEALNLTPSIPFMLEYPSSSPIPVVDSDFLIEEVDTFLILEDSIPPGIESDFDLEGDIIFLNNLLNDDPIPEYEHFIFDIEPDTPVINNFDELNEDKCFDLGGREIVFSPNVEDWTILHMISFGLFSPFSPTLRFSLLFPIRDEETTNF
ncbi:hypothetical protein Tco_0256842 [Tanacetum coccineum]